jgi:pilus assembly protein CpaC
MRTVFPFAALLALGIFFPLGGQDVSNPRPEPLTVAVGKSLLVESALPIERVSVGYGDIAEASAVGLREVLLNGRTPGATTLIIWQRGGGKLVFDVTVPAGGLAATNRVEAIQREIERELEGQKIELNYENDTVFLHGHVKDIVSADRAVSIASTLGRTVNLLYVDVPPVEAQIMLKVRFATIDRSASLSLGLNLVSTGAGNTIGAISTQQFSGPHIVNNSSSAPNSPTSTSASLSDALNVFLFRPDLNLIATIQALQQKSLLEILAEPDLLAMNGKPASFLAGGEFPFPVFQASAGGVGSVTIQFREFGVRLNFTPTITPRGSLQLEVAPEVSALDFTSGLVVQGFNVPAVTVRRVSTQIELGAGQSFAIGGLLDNSLTETISKIPVIGDIPVLGKLFQSKTRMRQNTELIVIVTPELVTPVLSGQPVPELKYPLPFTFPRTIPDAPNTPAAPKPAPESMPVEALKKALEPPKTENTPPSSSSGPTQSGQAQSGSAPATPQLR